MRFMRKKFPIGIQSFSVIREENYYYVDKTKYIVKLLEDGKYFFLSRPRRFGKSLFIDTMKQAFLGKKKLFSGLYLESNWEWDKKYPVIHISFGSGILKTIEELEETQRIILTNHANEYGIELNNRFIKDIFAELIIKLHKKTKQKVVVLVDEYDKPILDNIENKKTAKEIIDKLKGFYSVLKDTDEHLKMVFITGVSKFSKVSLFSGLNNLKDITLHPKYATICGYTQEELEKTFMEPLKLYDKYLLKRWYDGYNFFGENVYNPFDILLFLDSGIFRPYWFETGTPTFLIKLMLDRNFYLPKLENLKAGDEILDSFDIDNIEPETLLFQTGYLTPKRIEKKEYFTIYHLTYPNLEVKSALLRHIITYLTGSISKKDKILFDMYDILSEAKIEKLKELFFSFFVSIPNEWYRKSEIQNYEGFYASIFYSYFAALGLEIKTEESTNKGKLDMAVFFKDKCFIFEFKVVNHFKENSKAIKQIKEKKYYDKYLGKFKEIYMIGVVFSKKEKNIVGFEWERV